MNTLNTEELTATMGRLETACDDLSRSIRACLEQLPAQGDARAVISASDARQASEAPAAALFEDFAQATARLAMLPTTLRASGDEFLSALAGLQEAVDEFATLSVVYDNATAALSDLAEECGVRIHDAVDTATDDLTQALDDAEVEADAAIKESIVDPLQAQVGQSAERLQDAFQSALQAGNAAYGDAEKAVEQASSAAIGKILDTGTQAVTDELKELGLSIVRTTVDNVIEDMQLTVIAAEISSALSAQMPNLIIAKQATSAVKRGLDLLRSGGL